jgi:hypothetical protein
MEALEREASGAEVDGESKKPKETFKQQVLM